MPDARRSKAPAAGQICPRFGASIFSPTPSEPAYARQPSHVEKFLMMSRKVICDLHLMSVDFGREEERELGNIFRITYRHVIGQTTLLRGA